MRQPFFSQFLAITLPVLFAGAVAVMSLYLLALCYKVPEQPRITHYDAELLEVSEELTSQLMQAYDEHSYTKAAGFLNRWHREYRSNARQMSARNDTIKAVYDLFRDYFKPRYKNRQGLKPADTTYHYAVIQSNIWFYTADDQLFDEAFESYDFTAQDIIFKGPCSSISNFRPEIDVPGVKTLYGMPTYTTVLKTFLGWGHDQQGYQCRILPREVGRQRWKFLTGIIPCDFGADYVNLFTPPSLHYIVFNKSLDKAYIQTDYWHEGTYEILYKENARWEKVSGKYPDDTTWIE